MTWVELGLVCDHRVQALVRGSPDSASVRDTDVDQGRGLCRGEFALPFTLRPDGARGHRPAANGQILETLDCRCLGEDASPHLTAR